MNDEGGGVGVAMTGVVVIRTCRQQKCLRGRYARAHVP